MIDFEKQKHEILVKLVDLGINTGQANALRDMLSKLHLPTAFKEQAPPRIQLRLGDKVRILSDANNKYGCVVQQGVQSAVGEVGEVRCFGNESGLIFVGGLSARAGTSWWYARDQLEYVGG